MRILLARHGTAAAPRGVAIGWTDVELTEAGRRQAEALAERLAASALERVYSSDLRRALETASIVADRQGLPVHATPELRELVTFMHLAHPHRRDGPERWLPKPHVPPRGGLGCQAERMPHIHKDHVGELAWLQTA